ncbi:hypothetical protein ACLMJK_006965 [Lecanora helva]
MLRRPPTTITLTPEDLASYTDRRLAQQAQQSQNQNQNPNISNSFSSTASNQTTPKKAADPNDELKPLPADRARVRSGMGIGASGATARGREERIMGR